MLKSKTVFIIGAGASKEVGFPLGSELKNTISTKLDLRFDDWGDKHVGNGDMAIYQVLRQQHQGCIDGFLQACWQIRDGIALSDSIDDFIDVHQHDEKISICGKLAIASSILEAERSSKLFFERKHIDDTINFKLLDDTWYSKFYRLLAKQTQKTKLENIFDNVTVVNFNYDRSLEHFLVHAFRANYHIKIEEAQKLVQKLTIYRPYGSVGPYFGHHNPIVEFGFKGLRPISEIITNLKTYTEQIDDGDSLNIIRSAIQTADVLVFLGMAFHPNNMHLLKANSRSQVKRIYATRKGISDHDLRIIIGQIDDVVGRSDIKRRMNVNPNDIFFSDECHNLFDVYQRALALI